MPLFRVAEVDPHAWRETVAAAVGGSPVSFLFESGLVDPVIGRYSYAGTDPYMAILSKDGEGP